MEGYFFCIGGHGLFKCFIANGQIGFFAAKRGVVEIGLIDAEIRFGSPATDRDFIGSRPIGIQCPEPRSFALLPVAKMASQPIVKDVNSKFYFLLEYITGISNELDVLFENSHTWENADEDLLNEFLTVSGNSALIEEAKSKIFSSE